MKITGKIIWMLHITKQKLREKDQLEWNKIDKATFPTKPELQMHLKLVINHVLNKLRKKKQPQNLNGMQLLLQVRKTWELKIE